MRLALLLALLCLVACVPTPTPGPTPTCNALATMWPTDIEGPDDWGTICPTELPGVQASAYTVYGRVTVYETIPLAGAEIGVNRYADGVQTGLGIVWSDADGEFCIEVTGQVDALRIYIIYPPEYVPRGVASGGIPRALDVIHWANPPADCGPIHFMAAYRWTPTPTVSATPSRTPTRTLMPTATQTATITPTPTQTSTPTVTPTVTVTPTPTAFTLIVPPELRMTPAATHDERQQQVIIIAVYAVNVLRLWTYIAAAMAGLSVAQNVVKWKKK